ncbi:unnamed protein product [Rhizophagus irregularis]|uniref:AMP-dependent synthetase/ligase domain-containing protein n=1 Tax=Rhizophagus irregularis TaxID=588596 RepID=A0A915YMH5_9GLOM|nr:unnamed protein product [Rhizophagus irregularis]
MSFFNEFTLINDNPIHFNYNAWKLELRNHYQSMSFPSGLFILFTMEFRVSLFKRNIVTTSYDFVRLVNYNLANSKKLAFGLINKIGFKRGDVLAICSHNHIDYPVVIFGAIAAGGIVTTVNPNNTSKEFASQLKDCDQINHENIFMGSHDFFHIYGLTFLIHFIIIKISLIKERKYDLSSLKLIISSTAPLSGDLCKEFVETYNVPIKQAYGLTETSPFATAMKTHEIVDGSIGVLIPNMECKVISEDNKELGYNESGEFCFRGPNIMKGYLNNKEATKACIDSDGWFHTGDFGYVDPQGNFFIVDRFNELIKYKEFQIIPSELESILLTHSSINDSAVIGNATNSNMHDFIHKRKIKVSEGS